jgi:hypothetical protein
MRIAIMLTFIKLFGDYKRHAPAAFVSEKLLRAGNLKWMIPMVWFSYKKSLMIVTTKDYKHNREKVST